MKVKLLELWEQVRRLEKDCPAGSRLPCNTYYLNDREILCNECDERDARFPYDADGLNLWVHSGGWIVCNESNLSIFRTPATGELPSVEFWGGLPDGDAWKPVSITGVTAADDAVRRFVVYAPRCAYVCAVTDRVLFGLRVGVSDGKELQFTVSAVNLTDQTQAVYTAAYFQPLLCFANQENEWAPYVRFGRLTENGAVITRLADPGSAAPDTYGIFHRWPAECPGALASASQKDFLGGAAKTPCNARALRTGHMDTSPAAAGTQPPAYAELVSHTLPAADETSVHYTLAVVHEETAVSAVSECCGENEAAALFEEQERRQNKRLGSLSVRFGPFEKQNLSSAVFNRFLDNVRRQVQLCAFSKNYAGELLGVRDVFQQLTAAQLWDAPHVRERIVSCLQYIFSDGRPPRQFSVPPCEGDMPKFDTRLYIDQGLWIVETVYQYVCQTGDTSVLYENCGYYDLLDEAKGLYRQSQTSDSVFSHLRRITDFLLSNIDERTGCLRILFGDWNDAIDGLGTSQEKGQFGTGVSVMASQQLYLCLWQMNELARLVGDESRCAEYDLRRERLREGLRHYALQNEEGGVHIVHGWGDQGKDYVGSCHDSDGSCRYSSTVYSFWCISGLFESDPSIKTSILRAFDRLDTPNGLLTLKPYFPKTMKEVGRIVHLTPGTAENECTYVHAVTFAVMALFLMGESRRAWEQIFKILPITHERPSKTPFVMPNSYCVNEAYGMTGQSMGDWYTGSGAVLVRCVVQYALGLRADLKGLKVVCPRYMPSDTVTLACPVKQARLQYTYHPAVKDAPQFLVNGQPRAFAIEPASGERYVYIKNEEFNRDISIEIV